MRETISLPLDRTTLFCIDLQEEHRGDPRYLVEGYGAILANVAALQQAARSAGVPVMHFSYIVDTGAAGNRPFHPTMADGTSAFSDKGDPMAALCAETGPAGDEAEIVKSRAGAFTQAATGAQLKARGSEWIVVTGVWTEACVDATVKEAIDRGYRVLLVKDACGSGSEAMHQTGILNLANRLYGGAVADTQQALRLLAGEAVELWRVEGSVPLKYGFDDAPALYASL